jgi:cytochrome c2
MNEEAAMRRLVLAFAVTGAMAAALAAVQARAKDDDAAKGRELAFAVCGNCHLVEKGQPNAPILKPPAPAFSALAQRGAFAEESLRAFLAQPHGQVGAHAKMPNPRLLDYQIDRVVAYLKGLPAGR